MKTLISTIVLTFALALPLAHAGQEHGSGKQGDSSGMGMHKGMMDKDGMHQHMQKMRKTMKQIHNSKDDTERQRLMHQHMQQMHESMGAMQGGMMGDGNMGKKMQDMSPEKRQQMMEERMQTMQGMMEQMMEHMKARHSMGQDQ
ncbi:hypothetical protein [Algiphilus aromaticivorans]|jgi:hypothetical protein|uniref:hypothetical protein n=1 Tax=Algiphilus aromaticivorans TaxID=382454 RepID=UPI0005C1DD40|nr:hypothetical protein [Algiphilus aromaticivorans]